MPHQTLDPTLLQSWRELISGADEAAFIRDMIDGFLTDSAAQLAALEDAWQAGDSESCRFLAHRLRGGSSAIGATRLGELCGELEVLLEAGSLPHPGDYLSTLREEYGRVRLALERERP
jgi:histidine phosphotransfer protein HptB